MWSDEARRAAADARSKGAHATGVDQVGRPVLSPQVLAVATGNPNGFSVTTGGQQPTNGFMVALPGHSLVVDAKDLQGPQGRQILENYARDHAEALKSSGAHLGGWTDKTIGKTYLDVSQRIGNKNAAIRTGTSRNQKAIYDVRKGKDINTGGDGT